jgi:hypothetical protein
MNLKSIIPAFILFCGVGLFACNNAKKDEGKDRGAASGSEQKPAATEGGATTTAASSSANLSYTVEGKEFQPGGGVLVTKDKDKLSAGHPYFAMVTANGPDKQTFAINFVFDLKPGSYPVVGHSFSRGSDSTSQVFGGLLGGQPKLTSYKVNITECTNLGSNNAGGNKWKISGAFENITIPAMGFMASDPKHPKQIVIEKGSFTGLSFDDNWEQMMEEGMKKLKK